MTGDGIRRRGKRLQVAAGILATALVLVTLVGCGVIGQRWTEIEWYTNYFEKYYLRWFNDFEKAHADEHVRIKFRAMPGNAQQKVYTMLISHTLSDVTVVGGAVASLLYKQDALEPVQDLDRDDYMPIALKMASNYKGTLVGYPTGAGLRPFIYFTRKSLNDAQTNESEVPETFDEYQAWASRLFRWEAGGREVFGALPASETANARLSRRPVVMIRGYVRSAIPFILAYVDPLPDADGVSDGSIDDYLGGPPSNRPFRFTNPQFVQGLAEYQKWFLPKETAIADGDASGMQAFQQDVYAGMEAANWIYGEVFGLDFQVTKFPHAPGKRPRLYVEGGSVGVSRESKHKKLAIEFAKFISAPEAQVDAYYGHGYTPCRYSAWKRLYEDVETDAAIREKFLAAYGAPNEGFAGVPEIKRRYHDAMDVSIWVPLAVDQTIVKTASGEKVIPEDEEAESSAAPEGAPKVRLDVSDLEARYKPAAEDLARKIAEFSGQNVTVIVRGTPPDMVPARSFAMASPIPVYTPLLKDCGVYVPQYVLWDRIQTEVISRMLQFLERADAPFTPQQAAEWAQKEAEDIAAGRK